MRNFSNSGFVRFCQLRPTLAGLSPYVNTEHSKTRLSTGNLAASEVGLVKTGWERKRRGANKLEAACAGLLTAGLTIAGAPLTICTTDL